MGSQVTGGLEMSEDPCQKHIQTPQNRRVTREGGCNQNSDPCFHKLAPPPPLKITMSPEVGPFQNEDRLPTKNVSGDMLVFGGSILQQKLMRFGEPLPYNPPPVITCFSDRPD